MNKLALSHSPFLKLCKKGIIMKQIQFKEIQELPNNEILINGEKLKYNFKFYRYEGYSHKTNDCVYYGDGFYTRRDTIIRPTGIILDQFILSTTKNNKFYNIKNLETNYPDPFPTSLYNELLHKKITIVENKDGSKSVMANGKQVIKLRNSVIEELTMKTPKEIPDYFLSTNIHLKKLNLPNVKLLGRGALYNNKALEELNLPKVEYIRDDVLFFNNKLKVLNLPNAKSIISMLRHNEALEKIYAPKLKTLYFASTLLNSNNLKEIYLPLLEDMQNVHLEFLLKQKPELGKYIKEIIEQNLANNKLLQEQTKQHTR